MSTVDISNWQSQASTDSGALISGSSASRTGQPTTNWRWWHGPMLLIIVLGIALVGVFVPTLPRPASHYVDPLLWSWLAILALLAGFIVIAGNGITGLWRGALIDDRNKISLSHLQMIVWTIIVLSGFLAAALSNVYLYRAGNSLAIAIPPQLWALMGITVTSLIGSPLILNDKKSQTPDPAQASRNLKRIAASPSAVRQDRNSTTGHALVATTADKKEITHEGVVVVNVQAQYASWSDLFTGEETGNVGHLDLGKIQMFYFTFIVVFAYAMILGSLFATSHAQISAFPQLDSSMVALLGISNAGYLGYKAVAHSLTQ